MSVGAGPQLRSDAVTGTPEYHSLVNSFGAEEAGSGQNGAGGGEKRLGEGGGTDGSIHCHIPNPLLGSGTQHGAAPVSTSKRESGLAPLCGLGLYSVKGTSVTSPKESLVVAAAPTESNGSHFGTAVPMGVQELRTELTESPF